MRAAPFALALLLAAGAAAAEESPPPAAARPDLLDGAPWILETGATTPGAGPGAGDPATRGGTSGFEPDAGPGGEVRLAGSTAVTRWTLAGKAFPVRRGAHYRLLFETRAEGLRLDEGQRDNAYVGVRLPGGPRPDLRVRDIGSAAFAPGQIAFRAPADGEARAVVFLSKTGTLAARNLRVEELGPADAAEVLLRELRLYYPHFAVKGIDPAALEARHRPAMEAARGKGPDEARDATLALLRELRDIHVTLADAAGEVHPSHRLPGDPGLSLSHLAGPFPDIDALGAVGFAGTSADGIGYLALASLPADPAAFAPVLAALDGMKGKRGLVLDLRACAGGDERRGQELAARLASAPVVYARSRWRAGPGPGDLGPPVERRLEPAAPADRLTLPVAVLVGPRCVSSGEGLALMLAALPGVPLLGLPTAGHSGNPAPVELPDGTTVRLSRWTVELPDGTPLEGRGVPPDTRVEPVRGGDAALDAALAHLRSAAKR